VDINIVDADVVDVLLMLAEASDLNIVVDERVHKILTLRLVDVPVDQAIRIILELSDLEAVTLNGAVVIRPIGGTQEDSSSED
jgi:type II secretory pathway component HofQ